MLTEHGLWLPAAKEIVRLKAVHPRAQWRFVKVWRRYSFCPHFIGDDDLLFAFLRKVMPPYEGDNVFLYRGQCDAEPIGASWTVQPHIAFKHALFGERNVDAMSLALDGIKRRKPRHGAVIMKAFVPATNIISMPASLDRRDGEYIVDSRGIAFATEPALQAAGWIRADLIEGLEACVNVAGLVVAVARRHKLEGKPLEILSAAADAGDLEAEILLGSGMVHPFVVDLVMSLEPRCAKASPAKAGEAL